MGFFSDLLDRLDEVDFYKEKTFQRVSWGLFVLIALITIVIFNFLPERVGVDVGQVSKRDIIAPRTIEYIDQEETEQRKEEAAEAIAKVYEEDATVWDEVEAEIRGFFELIRETRELEDKELESQLEIVIKEADIELSSKELEYLLQVDQGILEQLQSDTLILVKNYLNQGIKDDSLVEIKEQIKEEKVDLEQEAEYNDVAAQISSQVIRPNLIFNQEETEQRRELARQQVEPVKHVVYKGEVIVRHGKVVTEEDVKVLEALGLRDRKLNYFSLLGYILIVLIFFSSVAFYIYQYQAKVLKDEGIMALLGLLPIIILLLAKIANYLPIEYPSFIVPVAAASIIITILINTRLAVIFTIGLSFLVAIVSGGGIIDVAVAIVSGLTGIYSVSKVSQRSDLVRAGFIVSATSAFTILAFLLIETPLEVIRLLKIVPLGILNGVLVAIVTNGLLPYIENIFGVTSPVKLLELSNPNHQLLKRLLVEAPGTYHHSIIVGNLAESAADQVNADPLLTRVGAYYHDIGKIKRSYFFTENQIGKKNPHDKLSPNLSTLIITSHIKDGIELAQEHKLPEVVIDIITQHHGTSLVSFFYQEAVYDEKYKNVDKDDFRYDGPKPQTKEAALIMLADVVEAAVRSNVSAHNNPGKLEGLVRDLIKNKLNNEQLDECDLTLKDLDKIANSFVNILQGIFHSRVEYPDDIAQHLKEEEIPDGDIDQ
ncbi:HDIG domain-containing protein [Natroniella sulfidigena]|uniref:HD family phosphohydrolase n=1 Tax=Natroniella sulfidigena TaxID=723921 RepID=UPI00200A4CCC|nr:HDIG domain-containing metalloprotein [Natroniella sulfidigena]MCK8815928.1 HDIG domain-containing protein [Natroniella sulfidigena]